MPLAMANEGQSAKNCLPSAEPDLVQNNAGMLAWNLSSWQRDFQSRCGLTSRRADPPQHITLLRFAIAKDWRAYFVVTALRVGSSFV